MQPDCARLEVVLKASVQVLFKASVPATRVNEPPAARLLAAACTYNIFNLDAASTHNLDAVLKPPQLITWMRSTMVVLLNRSDPLLSPDTSGDRME